MMTTSGNGVTELRGRGSAGALANLVRRIGVLRHPIRTARILRRYGGTLPAAIELGARRDPRRIALVHDAHEITYGQLRESVRATTARLADRLPAGAKIGIRTDATASSIVLLAAAVAAGLDAIPLGARLGAHDHAAVMQRERLSDVLEPAREVRWGGGKTTTVRRPGRLLILSSGSTGLARVTTRSGFGVHALVPLADLDRRIQWPRGSVLVLPPLDHGHGLSAVIAGLLRGETVLLGSELRNSALGRMMKKYAPTSVTGVPLQLIRTARAGLFDAGRVTRLVSGSSRLDDAVAEELRTRSRAHIIDCLGTTETGTFAVRYPPAKFRPLAGVKVSVDDEGHVTVTTPLAAGATRTGDFGQLAADGLELEGRADGLVDSAGELVAPERVSAAIHSLPQVHSCHVEVVEDDLRGAVLVARVRVHQADDMSDVRLKEALLPVLGRSGLPQRIDVVRAVQAQRPA